jgi:hypothetical protein
VERPVRLHRRRTRAAVRSDVFGAEAFPQMLLSIGWGIRRRVDEGPVVDVSLDA